MISRYEVTKLRASPVRLLKGALRLRNFGLLGCECKCCASLILISLSWGVPNLSPGKCVRVLALMYLRDHL